MTATAYKEVIQKAVRKGKSVKKQVLEECRVEEEVKKEQEIQREVDKRIREGELGSLKYPYGHDPHNQITMVNNPEDEVYGNLPMSFKVDIGDAVNFIEAWEGAKIGDMRSAFMESHLTNKVKDEYFDELRKRLEVAKREGHSQIIMPTPTQEMAEEMEKKNINGENGNDKDNDLAATFAPLFTLQKIMGDNGNKEAQEKPTEIVKTIMEAAKGIADGKSEQEKPTDIVKGILETAKELSANQNSDASGAINPLELTNTILAAAEVLSQSKQPATTQESPDILQQITAVSELINVLSKKENGESSENKIQVPRDDGSIMEMTVQQYMLSEMLRAKLASAQQPTQPTTEEKPQHDIIKIQDPDGTIRSMPATTYISELALKRMSEKEEQMTHKPTETERVSQDNTKLMAALVATIDRISTEVSQLKSQNSKGDDPIQMLDTMLAQGDKIDNFRRRFLGGGLTDDDKKREQDEIEMQRAHELKLAQMQTQQANRSALTSILTGTDPQSLITQEETADGTPPTELKDSTLYEKETIRRSQRRAEQMIEGLARERALAEKIAEERASQPKVQQHQKRQPKEAASEEVSRKGEVAKATVKDKDKDNGKLEEKVKPKGKVKEKE